MEVCGWKAPTKGLFGPSDHFDPLSYKGEIRWINHNMPTWDWNGLNEAWERRPVKYTVDGKPPFVGANESCIEKIYQQLIRDGGK